MTLPSYDIYFQDLAKQNPKEVCDRTLSEFDEEKQCYKLTVWGEDHAVFLKESRIDRIGKNTLNPESYFFLFILQYLLKAKKIDIRNEWISEKDIPGGTTFFRGPHEIPTSLITRRCQNDLAAFKNRCEQLGGSPIDMGDAAYRFQITPRIPVLVVYWMGDEDFPADARLLYDKTIIEHLPTDIVFALAVSVCNRIGK